MSAAYEIADHLRKAWAASSSLHQDDIAYIESALQAERQRAIEECAKAVEALFINAPVILCGDTLDQAAKALRALSSPSPGAKQR